MLGLQLPDPLVSLFVQEPPSQELSDEINQIKNATKPRLDKQEGYSLTPADFKANEEMSDKYFLEEAEQ